MAVAKMIPLSGFVRRSPQILLQRAERFAAEMQRRRTVRHFAPTPVPREVMAACLRTACAAPSGANLQPWHFVAVSDAGLKKRIRDAAEVEERRFYNERAPAEWLEALAPLGTDEHKPYLEVAPWLIAIFVRKTDRMKDGRTRPNYYAVESVGIATGFLTAALHHAGLATLTHTPRPMGFLNQILKRPPEEKPFLLLVAGYPSERATVPDIPRKHFQDLVTFAESAGS